MGLGDMLARPIIPSGISLNAWKFYPIKTMQDSLSFLSPGDFSCHNISERLAKENN